MTASSGLLSLLLDHFAPAGSVSTRRMFGCVGLFHAGAMFALVDGEGRFYLKADAVTRDRFAEEECAQFTYWTTRNGSKASVALSYFEPPDRVLDDPDELEAWMQLGLEAAARA